MKVRYLKSMGTPRGVPAIDVGDEAEVTQDQAKRLIEKGVAEPVKVERKAKATSKQAAGADKRASASRPKRSAKK